jgi:uncharacterized DUF497 family protein
VWYADFAQPLESRIWNLTGIFFERAAEMSDIQWTYRGVPFACDEAKRRLNLSKHGIDLVKASFAFFDPFAVHVYDADHSIDEDRFLLTGKMGSDLLVIIAYTWREQGVRLISARKAGKQGERNYAKQR